MLENNFFKLVKFVEFENHAPGLVNPSKSGPRITKVKTKDIIHHWWNVKSDFRQSRATYLIWHNRVTSTSNPHETMPELWLLDTPINSNTTQPNPTNVSCTCRHNPIFPGAVHFPCNCPKSRNTLQFQRLNM